MPCRIPRRFRWSWRSALLRCVDGLRDDVCQRIDYRRVFMRRVLILLLLVIFPIGSASAWNDTGHMTVALIAWRQLDDGERAKVAEILRQHPHYKLYLTADVPDG